MAPGSERDELIDMPTGTTIADYAVLRNMGVRMPDGLPLFKPPFSRITAIDMNTGEHLWYVPVGEMSDRIRNHPALKDMDLPNGGSGTVAPMTVKRAAQRPAAGTARPCCSRRDRKKWVGGSRAEPLRHDDLYA